MSETVKALVKQLCRKASKLNLYLAICEEHKRERVLIELKSIEEVLNKIHKEISESIN